MYNNLSRDDIIDISNQIKIGKHYRNKLKKIPINNIEGLRKEFGVIVNKYNKFVNLKKDVHKLIKKKQKLQKIQKGGTYQDIENKLKLMMNDLDTLTKNKNKYKKSFDQISNSIKGLSNEKLLQEISRLKQELTNKQQFKIDDKKSDDLLQNFDKLQLDNKDVNLLKEEKKKLEGRIEGLLKQNTELINLTKSLETDKISKNDNYLERITKLENINNDLTNQIKKIELDKANNNTEQQNKIQQLENNINLSEQKKKELLAEIEKIKQNQVDLDNKHQSINECKVKLSHSMQEINRLTGQITNTASIIKEHETKRKEAEDKIPQLKQEVAKKKCGNGTY